MSRIKIKELKEKEESLIGTEVQLAGWIKTVRDQKTFSFIEISDGSTFANYQIIADKSVASDSLTTGCAIQATGTIVKSPGGKQKSEMQASSITLVGSCPEDYPLQKKRHSFEFLRTIAHLRPRTNTGGAVSRVRNHLFFETHKFFQEKGFSFLQSPIITGSDCEGAGELFAVSTLDPNKLPKTDTGSIDYSKDFFGKQAFLTVSGQLNAESYACALSDVYTFGPTFRAENSQTARHLAEFWMIEPEMAFTELDGIAANAEEYIKRMVSSTLDRCQDDMAFFDKFIEKGLINRLENVIKEPFAKLTYTDAIAILEKSGKTFEYPVKWGCDLQTEHERYLSEEHCKKPVIITDYPKEIKAFYMRDNEDGKTVRGMDILVPKIGEVVGGAQREERYDVLEAKFKAHDLDLETYQWYLDLRKYGTVPHGGYGAGFERIIRFITGMENIRDVIPFPRFPGHADF